MKMRLRFRSLGLRSKMLAAPILVLLAFVVVGVLAVVNLQQSDQRLHTVAKELAPHTAKATAMLDLLHQMREHVDAYMRTRSQDEVAAFDSAYRILRAEISDTKSAFTSPERLELVSQIESRSAEYAEVFRETAVPAGAKVQRLVQEVLDTKGDEADRALSSMGESARYAGRSEVARQAASTARELVKLRLATQTYLSRSTEETQRRVKNTLITVNGRLTGLAKEASSVDRAKEAIEAYTGGVEQILATNEKLGESGARLDKLGPEIAATARELQDDVFASLGQIAEQGRAEAETAVTTTLAGLVGAGVGGLGLALFVTGRVVRPVRRGSEEVSEILAAIERGQGDLSQRLTAGGRDEVGTFIDAVNRFLDTLEEVIQSIGRTTQQLTTSANELGEVTERTQGVAQEQRSEIEQVATAMNEMTATAEEIARNTADAASATRESSEESERGRQIVDETITAINQLADQVETSSGTVSRLSEDSQAIGRVLDVIREVAEQTNLLALNAAIEASRAGDAGRGFAVVAEEVRSLASRVQDSTREIEDIIERLQAGARDATGTMAESREAAQRTVEKAGEAGQALHGISERIQTINDMATQIANAAEEQTATSESMNQNVQRANQGVDQVTGEIKRVSESGTQLSRMGEELRGLVSRFSL